MRLYSWFTVVLVSTAFQVTGQDVDIYESRREQLTALISAKGIENKAVLRAVNRVPRHLFVPVQYREQAYDDHALPIEERQTISQPSLVAYMTEVITPVMGDKVLEIGTGSGYQAAILAELHVEVYTIEIIAELASSAKQLLTSLGYDNIKFRTGDGYQGWSEYAPYDAIIVTAAPPYVPQALKDQLKIKGKMVVPVGPQGSVQRLLLIEKVSENRFREKELLPVRFVPMKKGEN